MRLERKFSRALLIRFFCNSPEVRSWRKAAV